MRTLYLFLCAIGTVVTILIPTLVLAAPPLSLSIVDRVEHRLNVLTASLQSDVQAAIASAEVQMATDPKSVEAKLKLVLETVESAISINPGVTSQLGQQLRATIRAASTMRIAVEQRHRNRLEATVHQQARRAAVDDTIRHQEKIEQLMARFNVLLAEGRYEEAQATATAVASQNPDDSALSAADTAAPLKQAHDAAARSKRQQADGNIRAMIAVNQAVIPSLVKSPIQYPSAEIWQALSHRRRKHEAMDMQRLGQREKEIYQQLGEPTRLEFEETPLSEVAEFLGEYHGIEVVLDGQALHQIGIDSSTPVTIRVSGISLRSGLRLMLRSVDTALTYTVRDEVLQISTREAIEDHLITRSYPVGDLVLPIQDLGFAGPGGFSSTGLSQGFGPDSFSPDRREQQQQQPAEQNEDPFAF